MPSCLKCALPHGCIERAYEGLHICNGLLNAEANQELRTVLTDALGEQFLFEWLGIILQSNIEFLKSIQL